MPFTMRKFLLVCILIFISIIVVKAFTGGSIDDSRQIFFYIWEKPANGKERMKKTLYDKTDSLRVVHVDLICENDEHLIDTIPCSYTGNKIYFKALDTTQHKLLNMSLSFEVNPAKKSQGFKERLTVSFLYFFQHSDKNSSLVFGFERTEGTHFNVNMSKLDYPFMVSQRTIESTIIN